MLDVNSKHWTEHWTVSQTMLHCELWFIGMELCRVRTNSDIGQCETNNINGLYNTHCVNKGSFKCHQYIIRDMCDCIYKTSHKPKSVCEGYNPGVKHKQSCCLHKHGPLLFWWHIWHSFSAGVCSCLPWQCQDHKKYSSNSRRKWCRWCHLDFTKQSYNIHYYIVF